MRISDGSSDVCSSDLFSVLSGGDENQILRLRNGLTPTGSRAGRRTGVSRVRGRRRENPTIRRTSIALAMLVRSEEHTSELQSLMRISYAVFCLKKKKNKIPHTYDLLRPTIHSTHEFVKCHMYHTIYHTSAYHYIL